MSARLLLRDVEVEGRRTDVHVSDGRVAALGPGLDPQGADEVLAGHGGALLPGLHDHHVHLLAAAAALASVDCGPEKAAGPAGLARALQGAPLGEEWVRGTGYHESVAGALDRHVLDRMVPDRPVRVQHRSGALWVLNTLALDRVNAVLDESADVERDATGAPTGRLWRYDTRLRRALSDSPPSLAALGERFAAVGVTGVTDATPELDGSAVELLRNGVIAGELPPRVVLMGTDGPGDLGTGLAQGPVKLLLRDHELPAYDELRADVSAARAHGRAVAVHCVTRESLLLTLAVLDDVGAVPGDRIEHAAVVPPGGAERLARLGLRVVTQPDFLRARGDDYLVDVDPRDLPHLYPFASLLQAGVPVAASSDAPYSSFDPWTVLRSATTRETAAGQVLSPDECVDPTTALDGYLSAPDTPGGLPRRITVGAPVDVVLLHVPLATALRELTSANVRGVVTPAGWRPA